MGAAYPVQGTFYFTVSVRHTATGIRIVFAIYLGNLTVLVFLAARTFYDIGVLQTNFLSRCHPEIFLGSVFHEVLTFHPQLTAELDRMAAGFRIFRVVDGFQLLDLSFRIVGDNQFHRIDHGGYTDGAGIQILAYGAFQQGELVQGVVSRITDLVDELTDRLRRVTPAAETADGRHTGVIPAVYQVLFYQCKQVTLAHQCVA